ncbi:hypothetical protein SUNI508_07243 [Seiridium unicorne]|uniref:Uncharacterized protein n=1 Tax=Seiridium unicorne TaxID=138068 RepID=A0ABR2UY18_9PEZI
MASTITPKFIVSSLDGVTNKEAPGNFITKPHSHENTPATDPNCMSDAAAAKTLISVDNSGQTGMQSNGSIHIDTVTSGPSTSSVVAEDKSTPSVSLGLLSQLILVVGTVFSLAVLGFLIFLWCAGGPASTGGEHAPMVWRKIMLGEWLTRTITLLTVILRVILALQATLCTSMSAALILERRRVLASRSVQYSIIRGSDSGPWALLWLVLKEGSLASAKYIEVYLILLLGILVAGAQFSSTILLSDLKTTSLVDFPSSGSLKMDLANNTIALSLYQWQSQDISLASFGETPTGYHASPNENGVSDTGVKRRALLPFGKPENRTALRAYEGDAFVFSSRVTCMAPAIRGRIDNVFDVVGNHFNNIVGQIQYNETLDAANLTATTRICNAMMCLPTSFNCTVATPYYNTPGLSACIPEGIPFGKTFPSYWNFADGSLGPESTAILVFATNANTDYWSAVGNASQPLLQSQRTEEWTSWELGSGIFVNVSLCFMGHDSILSTVSLKQDWNLDLPIAETTSDLSKIERDTTGLRRLLGADPMIQGVNDRGIFTIEDIRDPPDHVFGINSSEQIPPTQYTSNMLELALLYSTTGKGNWSAVLCDACYGDASEAPSVRYTVVFESIMTNTGRAAVALQSLYTMYTQSIYYYLALFLDGPSEVTMVNIKPELTPRNYHGLIAVSVMIMMALFAVTTITFLYRSHSRYSHIDEVWQTVAQVACQETRDILTKSSQLKDKDVCDMLKSTDHFVRLQYSEHADRVELVRCAPVSANLEK